jgi:sporulation related protein
LSRHDRAYDDHNTRHAGMIYILMLVIAVAFGGFVWNLYSAPEIPHLRPPAGAYKIAPPTDAQTQPDAGENAMYASLDGHDTTANVTPAPGPEEPITTPASAPAPTPPGPPQLSAAPQFAESGPYVAQLAALQSEAAVQPAWQRFASRAPGLFGQARMDTQRADLGARGIYYRLRAGYFSDRANATRFCERIRQMGQDCIVVAR